MGQYLRAGIYPLKEVLPFILSGPIKVFGGKKVKMNSLRYRVFASKGLRCMGCGIEGVFFALEQNKYQPSEYWHFNLYGRDKDGNEVLMTKDHILPLSKGGRNRLKNLQTMCTYCNGKKKDLSKGGMA